MYPDSLASPRTLVFPDEQPMGWIDIQPWQLQDEKPWVDDVALDTSWHRLGAAQGVVEIPAGMAVRLRLNSEARLDGLRYLEAGSLQDLIIHRSNVTDADLQALSHLRGLRALDLSSAQTTARGLQYLEPLQGLEHLAWSNIEPARYSASIHPLGLASILHFSNLKSLKLSVSKLDGTELRHLGALPNLSCLRLANSSQYDEVAWRYLGELQTLKTLGLNDGTLDETALRHLSRLSSLEQLDLSRSNLVAGRGLVHLGGLTRLKRLILSQVFNGLANEDLKVLQHFPALSFIGLGHLQLNDTALECLTRIPTLRELDISGNSEFTLQGLQRLKGASQLVVLDLGYARIEPHALVALEALLHLETLCLAGLNLAGALDFVTALPRLRYLDLSDSTMTDADLEQLSNLDQLESLNLENTAVMGPGLRYLKNTQRLRSLTLGGMGVEFATQPLAQLTGNRLLESLSVSRPLSPIEASVFNFPELYSLSLYGSTLLADDLDRIARLKRLRTLNLMAASVSSEGLKLIGHLPNLQRLYLTGASLEDGSVSELATLNNLEFLSVANTRIDSNGLHYLKESLPNCTVSGTHHVE